MEERVGIFDLSLGFLASEQDILNIALVHVRHELRKADFFFFLGIAAGTHDLP
jgi:hypothetical protein